MAATLSSRLGSFVATMLTAALLPLSVGSCALVRGKSHAEYCALMPDTVGLYVGNPVTHLGYQVGIIKAITLEMTDIRVDFTMTKGRRLPDDAKAIIRSTSVLADRSLELVGNKPGMGAPLPAGECIPLDRSFTPKSLSQVIGSTSDLIKSINPDGSTNVADAVRGLDHAIHHNGAGINQFLSTTSAVLNNPDQTINDIGSITANLAQLTSLLSELRGPVKDILFQMQQTMPGIVKATDSTGTAFGTVSYLVKAVADIEVNLGETTQFTLDATSVALSKMGAHARRLANLLNPLPWWINSLANVGNTHGLNFLRYRPPLYRVRTPNGVALCNIMNAKMLGSCANVQGTPYAVDVSLLQYVLTQAAHR